MKLVIVKSSKVLHIGYLGKDFIVMSSKGHFRDLEKEIRIDIEDNFKPTYMIMDDKKV